MKSAILILALMGSLVSSAFAAVPPSQWHQGYIPTLDDWQSALAPSTFDVARGFGASMDGITDDTRALQKMQIAVQAALNAGKNVEIKFPQGNLLTSAPLSLSLPQNAHLSIAGSSGFQFVTSGSNGAISITQPQGTNSSYIPHVDLMHLSAIKAPNAPAGGDAFFVQAMPPALELKASGNRCYSPDSTNNYRSCIHGININRSEITDTMFEGRGAGLGSPSDGTGIWIEATQGLYAVDNHIRGLQGSSLFAGVLATGHVEGLHVAQANMIGMAYCILAPGTTWSGAPTDSTIDLIEFTDGHCSSTYRGVLSTGSSNKIHNIVFYNYQSPTSLPSDAYIPADAAVLTGSSGIPGYVGVDLLNANWSDVSHNEFQGMNAAYSYGIHVGTASGYVGAAASTELTIVSNIFSVFQTGNINIDANVTNGIVALNELRDGPDISSSSGTIWVGLNRTPSNATGVNALTLTNLLATGGVFFGADSKSGISASIDTTKGLHFLSTAPNVSTHMVMAPTTLSLLQASVPCNSANGGMEATISDALSPSPGGVLVGGGSVFASAFCNGTSYIDR